MSDTLAGQKVRDTYGRLLQIANANAGADDTLRTVRDGQGDATALSLSTTHGDLLVQPANTTTARGVRARFGEVVNVRDYGAVGDGIAVDSAAIQAAADAIPADGGVLYIPPGVYLTNTPVFLKSNTTVQMYGATLKASATWNRPTPSQTDYWSTGYWMFTNVNNNALTITDENIEVWGGSFDYTDLTSALAPGGGRHAINFRAVRKVKVGHGTLYGGEDYTAFVRCDDTLVIGCSAYDYENCAYDHWSGAKNARVIGCFGTSANTVQHVNFNATGDNILNQTAENFVLQGCTFIHPTGGIEAYGAIFLDPLGAGSHTVKNVIIDSCHLHNIIITIRQDVQNVMIRGNQFFGTPGAAGVSPILCYEDTGDTPDGIIIDGNVFHEPQTAAPNVAVIDVRATNSRVTNNKITGTSYSVPAFSFGGRTAISFGNDYLGSADAGKSVASSGSIRSPNNAGFSVQDINGDFARWYIQTDNNMVFTGLNASGNGRTAWTWQQRDSASFWTWEVNSRFNGFIFASRAGSLTATGTVRGDALLLAAAFNDVTTVASGTGVRLMDLESGLLTIRVRNGGANALNVYPHDADDQIDALGAGNPYSLAAGKIGTWCLTSSGQWYTVSISP